MQKRENGEPKYKRLMEECKDAQGNVIKDENGEPKMQFAPDVPIKLDKPILERTMVYNIDQLWSKVITNPNRIMEDKQKFKARIFGTKDENGNVVQEGRLKPLRQDVKHFNTHKDGIINYNSQIRLDEFEKPIKWHSKDENGNLQEHSLTIDKDTIRAINRLYFSLNKKADFNQPLVTQSVKKELAEISKIMSDKNVIANEARKEEEVQKAKEEVKEATKDLHKQPQKEDNVSHTMQVQTGKPAKSASKAPKAKTKEATKEQGRGR